MSEAAKEIDVANMEAGKELDALAALEVMGWKDPDGRGLFWIVTDEIVATCKSWRPSVDIGNAFKLVETLRDRRFHFELWDGCGWNARFMSRHDSEDEGSEEDANTAAIAITRAAILAVRAAKDSAS